MLYVEEADTQTDEAMEAWVSAAVPRGRGSWTLQEYVMHPLLYRKRKFDMRVWALVMPLIRVRVRPGVRVRAWVFGLG